MTAPAPDGWRRLHPLTPLLRGGRFGVLVLLLVGQQGLRLDDRLAALGLAALGVVLAALVAWVAWRATRYRLTGTELQVDSGVLTRRQRRVPLARLQSVDVVRPLLARVLGLAELRLEVAGGGSTEAPLQYLSDDDAQALRRRLLALARGSGEPAPDGPEAVALPERQLVVVPTGPLVGSNLLGAPLWTAVLVVLVVVGAAAVDVRAVGPMAVAALPALLGVATATGRRVLTEHGFTVAEAPDGLRLRHGLLETRSATIPAGRVQLVRVREPLLWRPFGWVRVEVDVAGYARGSSEEQLSTSALLPVAPRDLALALVQRVLGPVPAPSAPVPARARWRAPLSRPRLRLGLSDTHLVSSAGVLTTTTDVVPLAKVQSLRLSQGPWQRRLRLASLHVDTAGRRLPGAVAWHRDEQEARALLPELASRARRARERVSSPG